MKGMEYKGIVSVDGPVIAVRRSENSFFGEIAAVRDRFGEKRVGRIIDLSEEYAIVQIFGSTSGLDLHESTAEFLDTPMELRVGQGLLGRIFNGSGEPRDKGPALHENLVEIGGPSVNPSKRIMARRMSRTGIPMIDVFNSLVVSQKLPIFSISGEPYNQLLARIAMQAEVDVIVLGGMGLKYDDYLYFKSELENGGALSRTVMFVHTAADPTVECLKIPDMSLAVAEQFALQGKDVLVLLTDMTNFADSMKEIAITQEQVPSNRGYPGDLYSQLAARYEKAVDFDDAGSVTVLAVTTMPGDDVTHPVPDNTGYITEGQYYLKGGRIEPFGSLSRLKQNVNNKTRDDHRTLMDSMIRLYASYKDTLEKKAMGFMMSEWDEKLLKYGAMFEKEMMDLSINIPLESALDMGWKILASCFNKEETGIKSELTTKYWREA